MDKSNSRIVTAVSNNIDLNEIIKRFRQKVEPKLPYRVNLVDILGSNENSHTSILAEILRFRQGASYPFLTSFLEMCLPDSDFTIAAPRVETQRQYIDALIWEEKKYAIILENKINGAIDQKEQIARYVRAAKELCGIQDRKRIFVVYLTADGRKKVESWSLTNEVKEFLGPVDEKGSARFIEINYRDDILPWLKESVIVNCKYGEHVLISMLQQYIDYLENRFAITEERARISVKMFLDEEMRGITSEREKYEWLRRLMDICCCPIDSDRSAQLTIQSLSASASGYATDILNQDYNINLQDAFDAKVDVIQSWATRNGFSRPHKSRQYECVFFEHRYGSRGCRMKFQINLPMKGEVTWVHFFNNDYDKEKIVVDKFPGLVELFKHLFPPSKYVEKWKLVGEVRNFDSEQKLLKFLDDNVKQFIDAYDREFERY